MMLLPISALQGACGREDEQGMDTQTDRNCMSGQRKANVERLPHN